MLLVEARGIEPLFSEPKSDVLPLYDASIMRGTIGFMTNEKGYVVFLSKPVALILSPAIPLVGA